MKWFKKRRASARALIIKDGQILVMHRKRYSLISGDWVEYFSIPGGGIEKNELAKNAVIREMREEMGLHIENVKPIAHSVSNNFEHHVFTATVPAGEDPQLQLDSEEAIYHHNDKNQFIPKWIEIDTLTKNNLRYYANYLPLIHRLNKGEKINEVVEISS